ncbi:MAG: ABC transporter permease subunit [Chitinophagaceae bacterium]|nr:ABC transporter permease subunit [Chitinophagaceae bacterium]
MNVYEILSNYHKELWSGLRVTLQLCGFVYPIGIIFGTLIGIARYKWKIIAGIPGFIFSLIMSSTPILVFLFWLHYPLQYMLHVVVDPFITSVVALSVVMTVLVSEQVRHALDDFPKQYLLSAKACGLSNKQIVSKIQLPMIFRQMIPNLLFAMVTVLQATLFTSMIGVNDIFRVSQQINSDIYQPVQIYTALAIFFIGVCAVLNILAYWLKRRLKWSFSEI